MILSFFLFFSQSPWNLARADQVRSEKKDCGIMELECTLTQALEKFFALVPVFREAFSQITAPEERAQLVRGLERLEEEISSLLKSKRLIMKSITGNTIEDI